MKILIITAGVLSNAMGAVKVHYDLMAEYKRLGHEVDKLDYTDLYPQPQGKFNSLFGNDFTKRVWNYLKENARNYDIIDANMECVVYPKSSFNFGGVLMARSHGIRPLYRAAEKTDGYLRGEKEQTEKTTLKTRIGNIYRKLKKDTGDKDFEASVKFADIVHCLNKDEYNYFLTIGLPAEKLFLAPNGLPESSLQAYNETPVTGRNNTLAFLGSWTVRKGVKDLEYILNDVQEEVFIEELLLLGGYWEENKVRNDFTKKNQSLITIVKKFKPLELPGLISKAKVALFPSYVEGLPYAIIEQLACGIPVVAYRVPGSADVLEHVDNSLLVEPGDMVGFAKNVIRILQMSDKEYQELVTNCKRKVWIYSLQKVADIFIKKFQQQLGKESKTNTVEGT